MQMNLWQQITLISATMLLFFVTSARSAVGNMATQRASMATVSTQVVMPAKAMSKPTVMMKVASWYGQQFQGRKTSSGEKFDLNKLTAASKTLPLGSLVRLRAPLTGLSVIVRINDRGPYIKGRDIDLSEAAAIKLGIHEKGVAPVEMAILK